MIYFKLFITFLEIGAFTFGGGYAMLPLIQAAVLTNGWLDSRSLIDFIAVSESTPGPFAVNIATYVGAGMGGVWGALSATAGVVLPSFCIILIVAGCFEKFKESKIVKGCMAGLKPAVVGLIGATVVSVAATVFFPDGFTTEIFKDITFYCNFAIFVMAVVLAFKKIHPIMIICFSAICGILCGYLL